MSLHSHMLLPSIPLKESVRGGGGGGGGGCCIIFTIVSLMCSLQTFWLGPLIYLLGVGGGGGGVREHYDGIGHRLNSLQHT